MVYNLLTEFVLRHRYSILKEKYLFPEKVFLYPEEGYPRTSSSCHWVLRKPWWNRRCCVILQVEGTKRRKIKGRVVWATEGEVWVEDASKKTAESNFRLRLTAAILPSDQRRGYVMTGVLERGNRTKNSWQATHLAVTKQKEFL